MYRTANLVPRISQQLSKCPGLCFTILGQEFHAKRREQGKYPIWSPGSILCPGALWQRTLDVFELVIPCLHSHKGQSWSYKYVPSFGFDDISLMTLNIHKNSWYWIAWNTRVLGSSNIVRNYEVIWVFLTRTLIWSIYIILPVSINNSNILNIIYTYGSEGSTSIVSSPKQF